MRSRLFLCSLAVLSASFQAQASPSSCSEEIQRGVASWYGPGFEGALTKSEEPFDPAALSAAHPDLPFGTKLKVTNMRNNRSVYVRVNDRGAFGKERVIDCGNRACIHLQMSLIVVVRWGARRAGVAP